MTGHASGARSEDLFALAKAKVSLADVLARESVKLVRSGQEMRGPCVLCDGGGQRFRVKDEKFRCYGCEERGDVIDLVAALRKCEPLEAAKWLLGADVPDSTPRERRPEKPAGPTTADKVAVEIWANARPIAGTLAERYLLGRRIDAEVVAEAGANLRYNPFAKHHWDPDAGDWIKAPAMVAQVVTPAGPTGGVHVTYIDRATAGKSGLEPRKRMWGQQLDSEGRPGGAWLIGPHGEGDLATAEGIETVLSIVTLRLRAGVRMRACAALSLNRLQGGILRDAEGCIDPMSPHPDPRAPAFTWPMPPDAPWGEVVIGVDADMADQRVKARTGRGKVCNVRLTSRVRARICGRLAVAAWSGAGSPQARAIAPPPGLDFNDELRRVLALETGA